MDVLYTDEIQYSLFQNFTLFSNIWHVLPHINSLDYEEGANLLATIIISITRQTNTNQQILTFKSNIVSIF